MVLTIIKFTITSCWLSNQKKGKKLGPRAESFANRNKVLQSLSIKKTTIYIRKKTPPI